MTAARREAPSPRVAEEPLGDVAARPLRVLPGHDRGSRVAATRVSRRSRAATELTSRAMRERLTLALLVLAVAAVSLWLAQQLADVLARVADVFLVFLLAWALAYLLLPLVSQLERRVPRLHRIGAVAVVYAVLLGILGLALALAVPILAAQLQLLVDSAPQYGDRLADAVRGLQQQLSARGVRVDVEALYATLPERLAELAARLAADALTVLTGIVALLVEASLVLIVAFFMLVDGERLWRAFVAALPAGFGNEAELLRRSADRAFGGFLRGQLILGFLYGLSTLIFLVLVGVQFAALLAFVSGLLMLIPFFGAFAALVPPLLVALAQGPQTLLATFVALIVLQNVMLNVVGPRLFAETVGIHPLFVFLALLLGARIAGFWGVFLAIPVAGMLNVIGLYALQLVRGERARSDAAHLVR